MQKSSFRNLIAWQKAMRLCRNVYRLTDTLPPHEQFGLSAQLRRAAVSVASNIAEGRGRGSWRDFRRFLLNARGSVFELQTQLLLCAELGYGSAEEVDEMVGASVEVARLINGLIKHITPYPLPASRYERRDA